jgi:hypothetical protein
MGVGNRLERGRKRLERIGGSTWKKTGWESETDWNEEEGDRSEEEGVY